MVLHVLKDVKDAAAVGLVDSSCRSAELTSTTPSCVFACCVSTSPRSDESPLSLSAFPPLPPLVLPLPLLPLPLLSLLSVLLPPLRPLATRR